jgi:hypothetical protein
MNSIIQSLEKIGQTQSFKSYDNIENMINENDLDKLLFNKIKSMNSDMVCVFVPEGEEDDSEGDSEEEISF